MVEALKGWVSNIVAVIFFVTLVEILLPDGKIKKYIGFIIGILVIITIMAPVVRVLGGNINIEFPEISSTSSEESSTIENRSGKINQIQSEQVLRVYREKLESSIKEQLKDMKEAECTNVTCLINGYENGKLGEINEIQVSLQEKVKDKETKGIKPVDININIKKELFGKKPAEVPEGVKTEVVRRITAMYGISPSKIKIIYWENG